MTIRHYLSNELRRILEDITTASQALEVDEAKNESKRVHINVLMGRLLELHSVAEYLQHSYPTLIGEPT
jgi:hypothetical protein